MRTVRRKTHVTVQRRNSKKSKRDTSKKPERWPNGQLKPGNTANPNGRPLKELCLTSLVKEYLRETDKRTGKTQAELAAIAIGRGVQELNTTALKEMLSRIDGPVKQRIEIELPEPFLVEMEEVGLDEPVRTTVFRRRKG